MQYRHALCALLLPIILGASSLTPTDVIYESSNPRTKSPHSSGRWRKKVNSRSQNSHMDGKIDIAHVTRDESSISKGDPDSEQLSGTSSVHETNFIAECNMPTKHGFFKMRSYVYSSPYQSLEPIVMISGDLADKENVLVRVHDQCFTSEVFGSLRCDCKDQLRQSLSKISNDGGVVIYLQQEGRGIGIANKIAAYALQDTGMDTVDANTHLGFGDELREYNAVPAILHDLGIKSIKLLTNNPYKIEQLSKLGVRISERVSLQVQSNQFNQKYLRSKKEKMNHFLHEELLELKPIVDAALRPYVSHISAKKNAADTGTAGESAHSTTGDSAAIGGTVTADPAVVASAMSDALAGTDVEVQEEQYLPPAVAAAVKAAGGYEFGKASVQAAINDIKDGKLVIVVDDANRENEGDLILAAEKATPDTVGMMIRYSSGVLCVSLEGDRLDALNLPPMVVNNEDPKGTAYSISVDYKYNTTTGISSADRALTFRKLVDPTARPEDFQRPGHVFPLRYCEDGVKARAGHTEASLDLSRLAGLQAGGVLAEVVHDDGSMQRLPDLYKLAMEKNLVLTSVQDIKAFIVEQESREAL